MIDMTTIVIILLAIIGILIIIESFRKKHMKLYRKALSELNRKEFHSSARILTLETEVDLILNKLDMIDKEIDEK